MGTRDEHKLVSKVNAVVEGFILSLRKSSRPSCASTWRQWKKFRRAGGKGLLHAYRLTKASPSDVEAFLLERKKKGLSSRTLRKDFAILKSAYARLEERGLVKKSPFLDALRPREEDFYRREPKSVELADLVKKLHYFEVKDPVQLRKAVLLAVFFSSGIRRTEFANLRFKDVFKLKDGRYQLKVVEGKGGYRRTCTALSFATPYIESWIRYSQEQGVKLTDMFYWRRESHKGYTGHTIYTHFKAAAAEIGFDLKPHDSRTSGVTNLFQNGFSISDIQKWTGHKRMSNVEEYLRREGYEGEEVPDLDFGE